MKKLLVAIAILTAPISGFAGEISISDTATYVLTNNGGQATDMHIRLSRKNGEWVMEGKQAQTPWKNISCDRDCGYRASTQTEKTAYLASFPNGMQRQFEIACIQNVANAFCRLTKKDSPTKGGYAFIALVSGKPIPMSLRRLSQ